MDDHLPLYDTTAIRELLLAAFTAEDLRRFCQDRADLREVLRNVGAKPSLNELADQVLIHCETHRLFDPFLADVRQLVPRQYEHFEPRLLLPEATLSGVPCPYRGLEVFGLEHAGNYFGRQAMVARLLDTVNRTNFVAVVGPSGCGKSSLVRAGMVPALRRGALAGSEAWQVEILVPGEDALRALALTLVRRLMPRATPVDRLVAARKLARHLSAGTLPLGDVLAEIKAHSPDLCRLLLVIDQFEETFTLCKDRAQSNLFLQRLLELAATPWLTVILTLRADFYGRVLEDEAFGRRVDTGLVNVLPMTRQERREAVEQPALQAGRRFEEGLVERILDAVEGSPGDLPLLEFALTELWGRQQANGLLTHAAYEAIGEVRGAIARSADDTFARFSPDEQRAVRVIFTRLVQVARPDEGAEDTRRRVGLDEMQPDAQAVVKALADARLLVTGRDPASSEETVEVAHEALIRAWAPLQEWLNRDREFLMWRQRLDVLAGIWEESGRGEGALLRDALLQEAHMRSEARVEELSALERAYLEESAAAAQRAEAAREAARQRELAQAQKLAEEQRLRAEESEARRRAEEARARDAEAAAEAQRRSGVRLRWLASGLAAVAVVALLSAWLAIYQGQTARARSLITAAQLQVRNRDPNLATLLALEAQKYVPEEAAEVLGYEIPATFDTSTIHTVVLRQEYPVSSVAWSPDGNRLAGGSYGSTTLWDVEQGTVVHNLQGHEGWIYSVAWSLDGRRLASGSRDAIKVWDVERGRILHTLWGHEGMVFAVVWSPDGRRLASGSSDGTVKVWDMERAAVVQTLQGHDGWVYSVAWSPDGCRLASGSEDGTIKVWDADRGAVIHTLQGHEGWVYSVMWSPDGRRLASGSSDSTIKVWDADRGEVIRTLQGHDGWVRSVAWSPNGYHLASGSSDSTIKVWDVEQGEVVQTFQGHEDPVSSIGWNSDGHRLAFTSKDGAIRFWDVEAGEVIQTLRVHASGVWSVASSPDGRRLASGSSDRTIKVWNMEQGEVVQTLRGHTGVVLSVAWSPDGRRLASGSEDETIKIWDVERGEVIQTLQGHEGLVRSVAWSPDGRRLASGSNDHTIKVWDVERGEALQSLKGHEDTVISVEWSPDGRYLASGSWDDTIKVWEVERGAVVRTLRGHGRSVGSVAWSPEGHHLASGFEDGTIKVWDMERGKIIQTLRGHEDWVRIVAWSPDGRRLASGSDDGIIKVWDAEQGEAVGSLQGHESTVWSVAWSSDERRLVSGSADGTIKVWPELFTHSPCTWVHTNLTAEQWVEYMGGAIYRPTCPALPGTPGPILGLNPFQYGLEGLLMTWPGRLVGLVGLCVIGMIFWGYGRMLQSRRRALAAAALTILSIALLLYLIKSTGAPVKVPLYALAPMVAIAGCTVTLLLWIVNQLGRRFIVRIARRFRSRRPTA